MSEDYTFEMSYVEGEPENLRELSDGMWADLAETLNGQQGNSN